MKVVGAIIENDQGAFLLQPHVVIEEDESPHVALFRHLQEHGVKEDQMPECRLLHVGMHKKGVLRFFYHIVLRSVPEKMQTGEHAFVKADDVLKSPHASDLTDVLQEFFDEKNA